MNQTIFSLLPPIVAIVFSLWSKQVNLSLFLGIAVGILLYCGFDPFQFIATFIEIFSQKAHDNMGVLIFIVLLGMIVYLMNLSGATKAYVQWAKDKVRTKKSTLLVTSILGVILFIDDYFNCMTIGTVMRPVSDERGISRQKLAYIIDSTAAPVCMIAPISSWAAAVSSSLPEGSTIDGFQLFLKTIPYNFYSLFSIAMVFLIIFLSADYGKMRAAEMECQNQNTNSSSDSSSPQMQSKGKLIDILFPILSLILFSIVAMLYSGGLFDGGITISEAFSNCDAIYGLAAGALCTVILMPILYLPRKIITYTQYLDGLTEGFKNMVPAVLILLLAWTLSGICGEDYLNAGGFVASVVSQYHLSLSLLPFFFFLVSLILAFSTGTSWGTFGILLPIVVAIFNDAASTHCVITASAILAGAVAGDHLSPISDTTIISSASAECDHISHVETQLQYAIPVIIVSALMFLLAGFIQSPLIPLAAGVLILIIILLIIKKRSLKTAKS